jgi:hypothetical protein
MEGRDDGEVQEMMEKYEIAVLKALADRKWRDKNYLKAKQAAANG